MAVVTPIHTAETAPDAEQSLRHLEHFLGGYRRFLFAPEGLRIERPGFGVVHFPDSFFRDVASYSRLLLSARFYRAFQDFEYILVYQPDCLVFSDLLLDWCRTGWDYVGAPWLADPEAPEKGLSRVGNGGLSLRRVGGFLRVLESGRYLAEPVSFWRDFLRAPLPDLAPHRLLKRLRVLREVRAGVASYTRRYSLNEDRFWSDRAALFFPGFRVAPVEVALSFAFERAPRYCSELAGGRLPFGCHAWSRWDRAFWEPHLLAEPPP